MPACRRYGLPAEGMVKIGLAECEKRGKVFFE